MLKLYYGRECLDKDRFLFDRVGKTMEEMAQGRPLKKILLVVPDQFTLQAEQNAFAYLDIAGMIDLEILSQSRLGFRVLGETGGGTRLHIDQYGRHMILTKIVNEIGDELSIYRGMKKSASFIELANDFITEMKQNNIDAKGLEEVQAAVETDSLLYRKLSDVKKIYEKYEEELEGKYIDTEDYMALFTAKIPQSSLVKDSQIWIYGFDSFTKKSLQMIGALMGCAMEVNVVMTGDLGLADRATVDRGRADYGRDSELFELTGRILYRLSRMAEEAGIPWESKPIPECYEIPTMDRFVGMGVEREGRQAGRFHTAELAHLERELYAYPHRAFSLDWRADKPETPEASDSSALPDSVRFCRAANLYAEVESAAARIVELTRDRGLRYSEIALICNDLSQYGSVIKRIFELYEIPVFLDEKRTVLHNPAAEFFLSLLDIVTKGWQTQDVFRFLKTGLFTMNAEQYEELENYAVKYRIRGRKWRTDFKYGLNEYGEEGLAALNELRVQLAEPLLAFEKSLKKAESAREKSLALYRMLAETLELPGRLEDLLGWLNDQEEFLAAEEISQIWTVLINLLDQMVELLGDEKISGEDYAAMLQSGLAAVEIGLLPPTLDQIIAGTMQRTRRGRISALLIIGANDGLLPADSAKEDLLSEAEKACLSEKDIVLCKNDDYRAGEERLAIYKNLAKPEQYLWISYSVSDLDGREKKPSLIFEKLAQIFPHVLIEKDVVNQEDDLERIQRGRAAISHMSETFRRKLSGDCNEISHIWKLAYNYLREESSGAMGEGSGEEKAERKRGLVSLGRGLFFTNGVKRLNESIVNRLYKKEGMEDFVLSPSRMERFGKCPFSHFVQYGLKPEERRMFAVEGREVGDVYHQCLMELSQELTLPDVAVTDSGSPWMTLSQEQCDEKVDRLIERIAGEYREGVLTQGGEEQYRGGRMKKIARSAAWAMISHVRQGIIRQVYFEAGFGQGKERPFPPVIVNAGGQRVRIEGKIDRVDVLVGGAQPYVKVVDYKSGSERFDMEEAREGIRLQLMLYLEGAMGGVAESRPAGVFYFEIAEPMINASGFSGEELRDKVSEQVRKSFKMDGIMVDDPIVIEGIAGDFSGFSDIVPVRKGPKGVSGTSDGKIMDAETFDAFRAEVGNTIGKLCGRLVSGDVNIHPKKTKYQNACRYCQFKGICFFDLAFDDCQYR